MLWKQRPSPPGRRCADVRERRRGRRRTDPELARGDVAPIVRRGARRSARRRRRTPLPAPASSAYARDAPMRPRCDTDHASPARGAPVRSCLRAAGADIGDALTGLAGRPATSASRARSTVRLGVASRAVVPATAFLRVRGVGRRRRRCRASRYGIRARYDPRHVRQVRARMKLSFGRKTKRSADQRSSTPTRRPKAAGADFMGEYSGDEIVPMWLAMAATLFDHGWMIPATPRARRAELHRCRRSSTSRRWRAASSSARATSFAIVTNCSSSATMPRRRSHRCAPTRSGASA